MSACPVPLETLAAYLQGELPAAEAGGLEEHYFGCARCAAELCFLEELSAGVRSLARQGRVFFLATAALVERAEREGARVRTYRLRPGEKAQCTATREDTFNVTRLAADLERVERIDVEVDVRSARGPEHTRYEDVPADRERGELVFVWPGDLVKSFPEAEIRIRVLGRREGAPAVLGDYFLHHTPSPL